jgi:tRNA-dihydrouridine synthase C
VDLNCGCPSKLVNGSGGGATLLKDPELIYRGAKAMREAVPDHLPVTVKVRLGWDSGARQFEIADAVQQAGATSWWFTAAPKKMAIKPSASTGRRSARSASG